jgi:hypothetical protein
MNCVSSSYESKSYFVYVRVNFVELRYRAMKLKYKNFLDLVSEDENLKYIIITKIRFGLVFRTD